MKGVVLVLYHHAGWIGSLPVRPVIDPTSNASPAGVCANEPWHQLFEP